MYLASVCRYLQCLIPPLTQVGGGVLWFKFTCSVIVGREGLFKQISLACVGNTHRVTAILGFPCLHCSGARLLFRERALSYVHFPGPRHSGSGFRVLHKGADLVEPVFCAFPIRAAQTTKSLMSALFSGASQLLPSTVPDSVSRHTWSGVPCVSSG